MKRELTVDGAGRILLPQPVRRRSRLMRGAVVEMEVGPEAIVLRPRLRHPALVQEKGLLVHEGEPVGDLLNAVEHSRRRRDRELADTIAASRRSSRPCPRAAAESRIG